MSKRSGQFDRNPRDFYPTPIEAVLPLLKYLPEKQRFIEPCAGDGRLVRHLEKYGHECVYACDVFPNGEGIEQRDVLFFDNEYPACDMFITNPPWRRDLLHPMIDIFRNICTTWLLFDSDWKETIQANGYIDYCSDVVPVGRVSWMDNGVSGMDNACWYKFGKDACPTIFHKRS